MHELSLVCSLLNQVAQIVATQGGGVVREIHLQCGPMSGVEPELIASAFELFRADVPWRNAALLIEEVSLEARCSVCQRTFEPQQFRFVCSHCGSAEVEEIGGDRVVLESITLEEGGVCLK